MNILISYDTGILPASHYGGTQRMVWHLGRALTQLGHNVTYLCREGSTCNFAQVIVRDKNIPVEQQIPDNIDIVHFNSAVPDNFNLPYVETIHGNYNAKLSLNSIFLSRNHAERFNSSSFVYNGLDWDDPEYKDAIISKPRHDYHFLGKAAWHVKNVSGAIDVIDALHSNDKLDILGGTRLNFKMGFRFTMSRRTRFHGMANGQLKRQILQESKGLIFPVTWDEPFGLAVIESLYYGAPAFCTPFGAMTEIITPEVGYLTNNCSDMVEHIRHANFNPQTCHDYARESFNAVNMAQGYINKYETVLNGHNLNEQIPYRTTSNNDTSWNK